jgi:hypothetical protein
MESLIVVVGGPAARWRSYLHMLSVDGTKTVGKLPATFELARDLRPFLI